MDEIALIRALASGAESPDAAARADALEALEGRFESEPGSRGRTATSPRRRRLAPRRRHLLRRRRFLAFAGVAATAAATALLASNFGGGNPSKAFAVEPQDGGGVTIRVYSLEDAAGLEKALGDAGIRAQVTWLPAGMTCRESHFKPSTVKTSLGGTVGGGIVAGPAPALTIGVMSAQQYRERWREYRRGKLSKDEYRESTPNVSLDPASFQPNQSVIIFGSPRPYNGDPEGGYQAQFAIAEGPVQPCKPVSAPAGNIGAIGLTKGAQDGAGAPVETPPGPGQFLYTKTKVVQLQSWLPKGHGTGPKAKPRYFVPTNDPSARRAQVPTTKEVWTRPDGTTRVRETLGQIHFLSGADQSRWEAAGSPPPFEYDPNEHHVGHDTSGRLVKQYASHSWRGRHVFSNVPKLSKLPTDPQALRLAIEYGGGAVSSTEPSPARSHRGAVTAERLMEILAEPLTSRALRAAALKALAEIPGIGIKHGAADVAGRRGESLTWVRERGFGREVIFDPHTFKVLAQAEAVFGPPSTGEYGVPPGTVFRETAYLQTGVVDSSSETAAEARAGGSR